ncbi:unnamed protein product [Rotaria magnacalcarata]|uniref:TIR domain-containing protein n=7 Tax=Rotaria magnacalcarata TaxID=392030 RepID=A0A816LIX6_9BILA|nr:unnamed protein product [Rotaria magnacalcarata]
MLANQLEMNTNSDAPSLLIAAHCLTIRRKTERIGIQELSSMLDDLFRELYFKPSNSTAYLNSLNQIVHAFNSNSIPTLVSLPSHYFFLLVRNAVQSLLQKSCSASQLNSEETSVLRNCIILLENLVKNTNDLSVILPWITDETFVKIIAQSLYHINKIPAVNNNKRLIKPITRLLNMFTGIQERLPWNSHRDLFVPLLQPIINCLTSSTYVQLFQDLKPNSTSLSSIEKFYLIKCPHFLESYNGTNLDKTIEEVLEIMLPGYVLILDKHTKTIKQWQHPMMRSIRCLLATLVFAEGCFTSHLNKQSLQSLIDHLLCISKELKLSQNINKSPKTQETILIDAVLAVFILLVYESDALDYIRKCKPAKIFQKLISTSCETTVLNACMMLAYTVDENDIKGSHMDLSRLTVTILNLLNKAVEPSEQTNSPDERTAENIDRDKIQLVEILKGLVKHEKVKKEILKQKTLRFLIECSQKFHGLAKQFLLECIWTLSFDQQAAQQIRQNSDFISELKNILISTVSDNQENNLRFCNSFSRRRNSAVIPSDEVVNDEIHKMADGLLWNLVKRSEFEEKEQKSNEEIKNVHNQKYKYDIMISYCHDDKDMVHKIQEFLADEGFEIFCELNNPQGLTMETQAEAISNSALTILCISNSYKQHNQCQALAEYAFNSKRAVLPIIVRKENKIDGWLNSIVGKNTPIDFTTSDFKIASSSMTELINQHAKKKLPDVKVKTMTPINIEETISSSTPVFFDRQQQKTYEYVISRPTTPGSSSVIVDRIPQVSIHSSSRPTTPGMVPIVSIVSLANPSDQIVLPEEFIRRDTRDSTYRTVLITNWKRKDILDFFFDSNLHIMMPICESMTGRALLRFFQMCQGKPSRLYSQINDELRARFKSVTLPMGVYTRFLIEVDNLLESISETYPILSRPLSSQLQQLSYTPDKFQPTPSQMQSKFMSFGSTTVTPTRVQTVTPNHAQNFTPVQFTQEPEISRTSQVVERTIFRPATAIDEPYNFIVESTEESAAILKQVERYASQLLFLEQKALEQRSMNGFH